MHLNQTPLVLFYASQKDLKHFATRGVLTPEHIIRIKKVPLIIENENLEECIDDFIKEYKTYFKKFAKEEIMLNPAPNYTIIKDFGLVSFGKNEKEASIIHDIVVHTMLAVYKPMSYLLVPLIYHLILHNVTTS